MKDHAVPENQIAMTSMHERLSVIDDIGAELPPLVRRHVQALCLAAVEEAQKYDDGYIYVLAPKRWKQSPRVGAPDGVLCVELHPGIRETLGANQHDWLQVDLFFHQQMLLELEGLSKKQLLRMHAGSIDVADLVTDAHLPPSLVMKVAIEDVSPLSSMLRGVQEGKLCFLSEDEIWKEFQVDLRI